MNTDRFANILGEEYNLFNRAVPHHDEFQDKVGEIIKNYTASLEATDISVVEGGCGTGITTTRILESDKRIKVIGIDNEEKTIKQARAILEEYDNRVDLKKEDLLTALKSMPDKSTDIFTLPHLMPPA